MLADAIRTLYDYNGWANGRVLDTAAKLSPEQLLAPQTAGQGSIRDTLVHTVSALRGWLSWWDGSWPPERGPRPGLKPQDFSDVAAIRAGAAEVEAQIGPFLRGLDDAALARTYSRKRPDGSQFEATLWQMMLHVANHGTQHRSEVAAMLTAAGHSPGNLDLTVYLREKFG
jgi:uncharacterized damage-inducible protein DinB